jgi:alkylation response protein AidB-like acyl-CoA dehydrogenase
VGEIGDREATPYSAAATDRAIWPATDALLPAAALDVIAAHASEADRGGRMADASLAALRDHGYYGMPVPERFGGAGASLALCAAAQRRLGMADAGLAIALNMHLFSLGIMVEHWRRHRDESWLLLESIATQGRVVASAFAEPGLGGSILRSGCVARPVEGGYVVSGLKSPCSLAARCDLICFQAQEEPAGPLSLLVALIPSSAPGVSVERSWDTLGMRASESDTLRLEGCHVPERLVFHRCRPGFDADEVFAAGLIWFCVTTAATYLGLVRAAIETALARLRRARVAHLGTERARLPSTQSALGEAVARVLTQEVACTRVAGLLDGGEVDPRDLLPAALAVKHSVAEIVTSVVGDLAELMGAESYSRRGALERHWRDAQAARYHPPTGPATRQMLGRWTLGLPFTFELQERPADD